MMADLWTIEEMSQALGYDVSLKPLCGMRGISIDSRSLASGDMFLALSGAQHDGHDYVTQAFEKGAACAVVERVPSGLSKVQQEACVCARDVTQALLQLARWRREHVDARVVGITGSVGKTSVKTWLHAVLQEQCRTHATQGNLNNHLGLPLTLARMPRDTEVAVLEMGMNHAGELTELSQMAKPDLAVITAVEAVHMEHFSAVSDIARAKSEIAAGLLPEGTMLLPADNPHLEVMHAEMKRYGVLHVVHAGEGEMAAYRLMGVMPEQGGQRVQVTLAGQAYDYHLPFLGGHHASNSVMVLALVHLLGCDVLQAIKVLEQQQPCVGRGVVASLPCPGDKTQHYTLIDDSYNASPVSMRAALQVLGAAKTQGKRIAVLGDMLEMGEEEVAHHLALKEAVEQAGVALLLTKGPLMEALHRACREDRKAVHAENAQALLALLQQEIAPGDVVLVKGSHGSGMWHVVQMLQQESASKG